MTKLVLPKKGGEENVDCLRIPSKEFSLIRKFARDVETAPYNLIAYQLSRLRPRMEEKEKSIKQIATRITHVLRGFAHHS